MTQSENIVENDTIGWQLADWLIENKIVEQIFGPNLHVEVSAIFILKYTYEQSNSFLIIDFLEFYFIRIDN